MQLLGNIREIFTFALPTFKSVLSRARLLLLHLGTNRHKANLY